MKRNRNTHTHGHGVESPRCAFPSKKKKRIPGVRTCEQLAVLCYASTSQHLRTRRYRISRALALHLQRTGHDAHPISPRHGVSRHITSQGNGTFVAIGSGYDAILGSTVLRSRSSGGGKRRDITRPGSSNRFGFRSSPSRDGMRSCWGFGGGIRRSSGQEDIEVGTAGGAAATAT